MAMLIPRSAAYAGLGSQPQHPSLPVALFNLLPVLVVSARAESSPVYDDVARSILAGPLLPSRWRDAFSPGDWLPALSRHT